MRRLVLLPAIALAACGMFELTPLTQAAREGRIADLTELIAHGEDPNRPSGVNDWPPIMHAVHADQIDSVAALLDLGADVNRADSDGETALMMAAGYGNDEIVKLLLRRGADRTLTDHEGRRAVDYAKTGVADIDNFTLFSSQESTVNILTE